MSTSPSDSPVLDLRLMPTLGLAWLLALAHHLEQFSVQLWVLLIVIWLLTCIGSYRHRRWILLGSMAALLPLIIHLVALDSWRARSPITRADGWADSNSEVHLTGIPHTDARPGQRFGEETWLLQLNTAWLTVNDDQVRLPMPLSAICPHDVPAGSEVVLWGRLTWRHGELWLNSDECQVTPGRWWWRASDRFRAAIRTVSSTDPVSAALLPALSVGDLSAQPEELRDRMRIAGLAHLSAVSGANLTIALVSIVWGASWLGLPRRYRPWLVCLTVLLFILVARPSPSVLRAAGMGSLGAFALAQGRASSLATLFASGWALISIFPGLATDWGFALSMSATAGILILTPLLVRLWVSGGHPARAPIRTALATTMGATATTAPLSVLLNPEQSWLAVPANVLVEPAVAISTISALAAGGVALLFPRAGWWLAMPGRIGCAWIEQIASWATQNHAVLSLEGTWPKLIFAAVPAAVICAILFLPRLRRPVSLLLVLVCVLAILLTAVNLRQLSQDREWVQRNWQVMACDVGQGHALAIRLDPGPKTEHGEVQALLIDVGPDPVLISRCLSQLGIDRIPLVVLTHPHADHIGALGGVFKEVPVTGLARPAAVDATLWQHSDDLARTWNVKLQFLAAGESFAIADTQIAVLWPPAPASTFQVGPDLFADGTAVNDTSAVLAISNGQHSTVVMGDIETRAQAEVLAAYRRTPRPPSSVQVVQVAHHGSKTQLSSLYQRLDPDLALIGVGENDYGHPHPHTLDMVSRQGASIGRTDLHGTVGLCHDPEQSTWVVCRLAQ